MKIGGNNAAILYGLLAIIVVMAGCDGPDRSSFIPEATLVCTLTPRPTSEKQLVETLGVIVLYPRENSDLEMGQSIRFSIQVTNAQSSPVIDAQVAVTVNDPVGKAIATMPAIHRGKGVYLTDPWTIPHHAIEDVWNLIVTSETDYSNGKYSISFKVKYSTSDVLLNKYGFWLDEPDLRGLANPHIYAEKGDALNGMVRWGGVIPKGYLHFRPARYVDVHWREGDFKLEDPLVVEQFVLEEIGDDWFSPVRRITSTEALQFKQWNAWLMKFQTRFPKEEMEGVIFYAPEVDKTYAIITLILLPPTNQNLHASLRDSFAAFQDVNTSGIDSGPLIKLLPAPELVSPPIAARFQGLEQPIVLHWRPARDLAEDEYYEVAVDYWYRETNPIHKLTTRQAHVAVLTALYDVPNCSVFNWQVTLMQRTGRDDNGQPIGEPISYRSLYWYFWWQYPPGERSFPPACPYTHYD
jgi:hypothetical protein